MFTPADVEFRIGWKADALRDFRRKGYLENYGSKGENGRWTYSHRDVVGLWIAETLHGKDRLADLYGILNIAHFAAGELVRHLHGCNSAQRWCVELHTFKTAADGMSIHGSEFHLISALDDLKGFFSHEGLDLEELARLAPDWIKATAER